jgi:hypothetical protein
MSGGRNRGGILSYFRLTYYPLRSVVDSLRARPFNAQMEAEAQTRTDAQLVDMLEEPGGWMVRAGASPATPQGTLRAALFQAFDLSADGVPITQIVKLPDDAIMVSASQIRRLWQRLGLLNS